MKRLQPIPYTEAQKYALGGAVFGLIFPVVATLIRIANSNLPYKLSSIATVQSGDSLLWIIDTAPIFLGLFAFFAGQRQDYLQKLNSQLKQRENELESIKTNLEQSIEARAQELVIVNQHMVKRAEQLRLIADVARSAISIQDIDRLLPYTAQLISQRFGFYHVGIFLLDDRKEYAILSAANSQAGLRMLKKGHRLKVGSQGIVGFVTQAGKARIALNVEEDPLYLGGVDLPDTRSEITLPLKSGDLILGALDIQSAEANAFSEEDGSTLSILADELAIAIQNAISYERSQRALLEAEIASRQVAGQSWKGFTEGIKSRGYRYDGVRSEALKEARPASDADDGLSIPVRLRGQTIGHLTLRHPDSPRQWTEDELAMAEATAERVALALEGTRLLEDAQKRAARETFLSDITAKLGSSFQMDSILRDTVQELGQTLKYSTVTFQLIDPAEPVPTTRQNDNSNSAHEKEWE
jgi:GAF domain-containing protein